MNTGTILHVYLFVYMQHNEWSLWIYVAPYTKVCVCVSECAMHYNVYTDCNDFVWAHTFILKCRLMDRASMFPHWNRKFYFIFFSGPSDHLLRVLWNIYFVHAIHRPGPHPYSSSGSPSHEHNISGWEKWWFFKGFRLAFRLNNLSPDLQDMWNQLHSTFKCPVSFVHSLLSSSPSQYVIVHPSRDRITFLYGFTVKNTRARSYSHCFTFKLWCYFSWCRECFEFSVASYYQKHNTFTTIG